jgi:hypothetical protein
VVFVGQPDKLIEKYDANYEPEKEELTGVGFLQSLANWNAR